MTRRTKDAAGADAVLTAVGAGFGHRGFRDLDAAAAYLCVGELALRKRLREGETLAEVATADGKPVDGLVMAIVTATTKRLNAAVAAGRMTKAQRDLVIASLSQRTVGVVDGTFPALGGRDVPRSELPRSA